MGEGGAYLWSQWGRPPPCEQGGCLPLILGGSLFQGGVSQHAMGQTPCKQNDRQVQKYYLAPNFVLRAVIKASFTQKTRESAVTTKWDVSNFIHYWQNLTNFWFFRARLRLKQIALVPSYYQVVRTRLLILSYFAEWSFQSSVYTKRPGKWQAFQSGKSLSLVRTSQVKVPL